MRRFLTSFCLAVLLAAWGSPCLALPVECNAPMIAQATGFNGWHAAAGDADWQLWYVNGVVTCAHNLKTDEFRRRDPVARTWGPVEVPPWGARTKAPLNFGVVPDPQELLKQKLNAVADEAAKTKALIDQLSLTLQGKLQASPQGVANFGVEASKLSPVTTTEGNYRLNGRPITRDQARLLVAGGELSDDSQKLRLTVIGSEEDRKRVLADLDTHPSLSPFKGRFLDQAYAPDNWAVKDYGFKCDGKPTIYFQRPDGGVLFRMDSYPGPDQLAAAFARTADPNYDPNKDKDGGKKPLALPTSAAELKQYAPYGIGVLALLAVYYFRTPKQQQQQVEAVAPVPMPRKKRTPADTADSWTYSTATWRQAEAEVRPPQQGSVMLPPPPPVMPPPLPVVAPTVPTVEGLFDQLHGMLKAEDEAKRAEDARKLKEAQVAAWKSKQKELMTLLTRQPSPAAAPAPTVTPGPVAPPSPPAAG